MYMHLYTPSISYQLIVLIRLFKHSIKKRQNGAYGLQEFPLLLPRQQALSVGSIRWYTPILFVRGLVSI